MKLVVKLCLRNPNIEKLAVDDSSWPDTSYSTLCGRLAAGHTVVCPCLAPSSYFIVGITNSGPFAILVGQRLVTVFSCV